ncbi:hypothetical protein [Heyndrickxia acidiproducens]|uniref:hypothetical protein n=1 Tax=Heyndrickxia acidiproducens TaxID=1121084 RepID=UPI00036F5607|nr:hypothetical protein [Heyndrickxia acidiproducens]
MDKYSCLAYLLFQVEDENAKNMAIRLIQGDITLQEAKADPLVSPYLETCEKMLKKQPPTVEHVYAFIEEYLYAF